MSDVRSGRKNEKTLLTLTIRSILLALGVKILLQRLLNSDSHGNGHADHGVVAYKDSCELVLVKVSTATEIS